MRNMFLALMVSQGTPLIWSGDEWMRTQLGNNNAYSTGADNSYNWMDWGVWQASDERNRMHDFVKNVIAFRKAHQYAFAPDAYGAAAPFSWKSPANTDAVDWNSKQLMMHFYDATRGPELAVLINGEAGDVTFTLPSGRTWKRVIDTQSYFDLPETLVSQNKAQRVSNNIWIDAPETVSGGSYTLKQRSMVVLQAD